MAKVVKAALITAAVVALTVVTLGAAGVTFPALFAATSTLGGTALAIQYAVVAFAGSLIAGGIGTLTSRGIEASRGNFGTKVAGKAASAPRQILYGQCRTGGVIVKMDTSGTDNSKLHLAIVLAGHEIESLDEVYFNENKLTLTSSTVSGETVYTVTNSKYVNTDNDNAFASGRLARFTFHDGSQTTVDGLASAARPLQYPSTAKFQGMAYVYMELIYDPEKMPNIPAIWFVVKGKKVYDPRTGSTAYSDNPALIVRDYLTDTTYGLRAVASEINDSNAGGGFIAAANTCEQQVTLEDNSTQQNRYTCSGFTNAAADGSGVLEGLLTSCGGSLTYTNGKFNLFVGAAQTAALTLTDEDCLGPVSILTKPGNGELFNAVKALFVDKTARYQAAESPVLESATYLSQDTPPGEPSANYKKLMELQLPFTTDHHEAQRLQKIALNYQRRGTTITVLTHLEFMRVQPGDWVQVTNSRMGYVNKPFEVLSTNMEFADANGAIATLTRLNLKEVDGAIYDYVYNEYSNPLADGADPDGGSLAIGAPTIGTPVQRNRQEGPTTKIDIIVPWTNSTSSAIQGTEVQYKESGESTYDVANVAVRGSTSGVIFNVQVGKTYDIRLRHFSFDNVYSDYSSVAQLEITEPDVIGQPANVTATTNQPLFIDLRWTNPSNTNLRAVEVHYSTTSGFTPSAATLFNTYYGDVAKPKRVILGVMSGLAYNTTYYFKLRAINIYGTASDYTNQVIGQFTQTTSTDIAEGAVNGKTLGLLLNKDANGNANPGEGGLVGINNAGDAVPGTNGFFVWNGTTYPVNRTQVVSSGLSFTFLTSLAGKKGYLVYDISAAGFTVIGQSTRVAFVWKEGITWYYDNNTSAVSFTPTDNMLALAYIETGAADVIQRGGLLAEPVQLLALSEIRADYISTGTLDASLINVTNIDAENISTGVLSVDRIPSDVIFTSELTDETTIISGGNILTGSVSADRIDVNGVITASTAVINNDIRIGSGQSVFSADSNGIYLGDETFASAEFRVTPEGALTATSATITGNITANTLTLTPSVSISPDNLETDGVTLANIDGKLAIALGGVDTDQIAFGAVTQDEISVTELSAISADLGSITGGSINIGSGAFTVSSAGALTATSATITGTVTANTFNLPSGATLVDSSNRIINEINKGKTIALLLNKATDGTVNVGEGALVGVNNLGVAVANTDGFFLWDGVKYDVPRNQYVTGGKGFTFNTISAGKKGFLVYDIKPNISPPQASTFTASGVSVQAAFVWKDGTTWYFDDNQTSTGTVFTPDVYHLALGYLETGSADSIVRGGLLAEPVQLLALSEINADHITVGTVAADRIDVQGIITAGALITETAVINNNIKIGSGESVFKADSNGIYLGNETFANAEFRVTPAGALTATSATITGDITANTLSLTPSVSISADNLATDNVTLINSGGQLAIKPGGVDTGQLATEAVTAPIIEEGAVQGKTLALLLNKNSDGSANSGEGAFVGVNNAGEPVPGTDGFFIFDNVKYNVPRNQVSAVSFTTQRLGKKGYVVFDAAGANFLIQAGGGVFTRIAFVYKEGGTWYYDDNTSPNFVPTPPTFTPGSNHLALAFIETDPSTQDVILYGGLLAEPVQLTALSEISADYISVGLLNADRIQIDNVTLDTSGGNLIIAGGGVNTTQVAAQAISDTARAELGVDANYPGTTYTTLVSLTGQEFSAGDVAELSWGIRAHPEVGSPPYIGIRIYIQVSNTAKLTHYFVGDPVFDTTNWPLITQALWSSTFRYPIDTTSSDWRFYLQVATSISSTTLPRKFRAGGTYLQYVRLKR